MRLSTLVLAACATSSAALLTRSRSRPDTRIPRETGVLPGSPGVADGNDSWSPRPTAGPRPPALEESNSQTCGWRSGCLLDYDRPTKKCRPFETRTIVDVPGLVVRQDDEEESTSEELTAMDSPIDPPEDSATPLPRSSLTTITILTSFRTSTPQPSVSTSVRTHKTTSISTVTQKTASISISARESVTTATTVRETVSISTVPHDTPPSAPSPPAPGAGDGDSAARITPAIIGGVVGGLAVLAILAGALTWMCLKQGRKAPAGNGNRDGIHLQVVQNPGQNYGPPPPNDARPLPPVPEPQQQPQQQQEPPAQSVGFEPPATPLRLHQRPILPPAYPWSQRASSIYSPDDTKNQVVFPHGYGSTKGESSVAPKSYNYMRSDDEMAGESNYRH